MKLQSKRLLLAGLMATIGCAAMAQTNAPTAPAGAPVDKMERSGKGWGHGDPAKMQAHSQERMQARFEKRHAAMKEKLKITPAQEGAWTSFTAAMKPTAMMGKGMRPDAAAMAEMDKLTTPERIDKMRALRQQRMTAMNAEMDKRADATKALYAALSTEQKAVFDAEAKKGHHRFGHGGPGGDHGEGRGDGHGMRQRFGHGDK